MTERNDFTVLGEKSDSLCEKGNAWYLAIICLVASIGGLLFGFDTAVIAGTVGVLSKRSSC